MFIPDPDFYPSRIPDPKTAQQPKRGMKRYRIPDPQHFNYYYSGFLSIVKAHICSSVADPGC
jgi:hypothetical protein